MKKSFPTLLKAALATVFLVLLAACARTADIDRLESMVEAAQNNANQALTTARNAQSTADSALASAEDAAGKAEDAQQTADKALHEVTECCAKVDRMFEKAMSK